MPKTLYPLDQSPLFRITSPKKLANILKIELSDLQDLVDHKNNYQIYEIGNLKKRLIEEPKERLQNLQKIVFRFLSRIVTPDYLYSARKGRSYVSNARAHIGNDALIKVDIKSFYQSVRKVRIFDFFHDVMDCASDVSAMLSKLLTRNDHLPTGGSASPLLSYFACQELFDSIYQYCVERNFRMTCYIDDIVISGPGVTRRALFEIRRLIAQHGFVSHKSHYLCATKPKLVTGVIVSKDGLRLPNRRHQQIWRQMSELRNAVTPEEKLSILKSLISRLFEASQIQPHFKLVAQALLRQQRQLSACQDVRRSSGR